MQHELILPQSDNHVRAVLEGHRPSLEHVAPLYGDVQAVLHLKASQIHPDARSLLRARLRPQQSPRKQETDDRHKLSNRSLHRCGLLYMNGLPESL